MYFKEKRLLPKLEKLRSAEDLSAITASNVLQTATKHKYYNYPVTALCISYIAGGMHRCKQLSSKRQNLAQLSNTLKLLVLPKQPRHKRSTSTYQSKMHLCHNCHLDNTLNIILACYSNFFY